MGRCVSAQPLSLPASQSWTTSPFVNFCDDHTPADSVDRGWATPPLHVDVFRRSRGQTHTHPHRFLPRSHPRVRLLVNITILVGVFSFLVRGRLVRVIFFHIYIEDAWVCRLEGKECIDPLKAGEGAS